MRLMIGTPLKSPAVAPLGYVQSLLSTVVHLSSLGIEMRWHVAARCEVARARDEIAAAAIAARCSHLLFVDADTQWTPAALDAVLRHADRAIVGVPVPAREPGAPAFRLQPMHGAEPGELHEVFAMGAAFMLVNVEALSTMRAKLPHYCACAPPRCGCDLCCPTIDYRSNDRRLSHLFGSLNADGEIVSEDYSFCRRARATGLRVFALSGVAMGHDGEQTYRAAWQGPGS